MLLVFAGAVARSARKKKTDFEYSAAIQETQTRKCARRQTDTNDTNLNNSKDGETDAREASR